MEPNNPKPIAVTIPVARKISGLGNTTVWKLIAEKKLATVRVGRRRLITYESLERLLTPAAR
jgi:excisionase family DNA binding protein